MTQGRMIFKDAQLEQPAVHFPPATKHGLSERTETVSGMRAIGSQVRCLSNLPL